MSKVATRIEFLRHLRKIQVLISELESATSEVEDLSVEHTHMQDLHKQTLKIENWSIEEECDHRQHIDWEMIQSQVKAEIAR